MPHTRVLFRKALLCFALFSLCLQISLAEGPLYPESRIRARILDYRCSMRAQGILLDAGSSSVSVQFRTPGNGSAYTLSSLAPVSEGCLETTTTGFVVRNRIVISPGDTLVIENERIFIANRVLAGTAYPYDRYYRKPSFLVEGSLAARNAAFRGLPLSEDRATTGEAVYVAGNAGGLAEASFTSCSFVGLSYCLDAYGTATVRMTDCRFEQSYGGVNCLQGSSMTLRNCSFALASVSASDSLLQVIDTRFSIGGASFVGSREGSCLTGCGLDGQGTYDPSVSVVPAVYIGPSARTDITNNVIRNHHVGMMTRDSVDAQIEDNVLRNNTDAALIVFGSGNVAVRGNTFEGNVTQPFFTGSASITMPAITILPDSQPDFGTLADPGRNVFRANSRITFYNATTNTLHAQGNSWNGTAFYQDAENLIYHQIDDLHDEDQSKFLSGVVVFWPPLPREAGVDRKSWMAY